MAGQQVSIGFFENYLVLRYQKLMKLNRQIEHNLLEFFEVQRPLLAHLLQHFHPKKNILYYLEKHQSRLLDQIHQSSLFD